MLGLNINWQSIGALTRKSPATISPEMFAQLKTLLLSQPYIARVESWEEIWPLSYLNWCEFFKIMRSPSEMITWHNEHFKGLVDLDKIYLTPTNIPYGSIHRWPWYCYPDMACDLSQPWLLVPPADEIPDDMIVVNRTLRARNESIHYRFLKDHKNCVFVGHDDEWKTFCEDNDLDIPKVDTNNLMELAVIIRSAKFFIGNQSLCFALAEAMKVPRILETCSYLPNVIPCGEKAYDGYFQSALEYYFNLLNQ